MIFFKKQQLKRVERQIERMQDEMQLYLKNETILPPDTFMPVGGIKKILYRSMEPESYEDELGALLNDSCPDGWESIEVDGCLEVVLIRSQEGVQSFFIQIKEDRKIVIDLINYNFTETFSRPLVSFKFSASDLWDLFTGKISIFITFSIDKYLDIFACKAVSYQK